MWVRVNDLSPPPQSVVTLVVQCQIRLWQIQMYLHNYSAHIYFISHSLPNNPDVYRPLQETENIVEKEKNAGEQHFFPFPRMLSNIQVLNTVYLMTANRWLSATLS